MKKISSLELYELKEKCLDLYKNNEKLVLKGNCPILVTTTLFIPLNGKKDLNNERMLKSEKILNNYFLSSYLDSLILYLNEKCLVHGIIDYVPIKEDLRYDYEQVMTNRLYSDKFLKEYIKENGIEAIYSLTIGNTIADDMASISEKISSYSFMGLTGISIELANRFDNDKITNHMGFGGSISCDEFKKQGYEFTDDTILFNTFLKIGVVKNKNLEQEKSWPRTVEIGFKEDDDTYNIERIGKTLQDYFSWVNKELQEKGRFNAMAPMKQKIKKIKV